MGTAGFAFKTRQIQWVQMTGTIAIITPAYDAERWIGACAQSVLAQDYDDWEHWIVADDGRDYEAVLAAQGIRDSRFRFTSTGRIGAGAGAARNAGLNAIATPYAAVLDADDRFLPGKLSRCVQALETIPLVSTAIDDVEETGQHLRYVGDGPDRLLTPAQYKFVNLSMDCMIAWDRRLTDGRADEALGNMIDLDLLLQLYRTVPRSFHSGTPLHAYTKMSQSLSNGPGVTERMIAAKRT
jgi:glycosyltransferase involved in cell wall biosynthesis